VPKPLLRIARVSPNPIITGLIGQRGQRGWKSWARERPGCLQAPAIGNITHGGLGSGPQDTAPLPTVVRLAGRAGLKNVGLGLVRTDIP
jgi:hypothetical protein